MSEFKRGDLVVVRLTGGRDAGHYMVGGHCISENKFSPLPLSISPEAQAVLDAALAWNPGSLASEDGVLGRTTFFKAFDSYRASLCPLDPIAELLNAARGVSRNEVGTIRYDCLSAAIAAVEARREKQK